MVLLVFSFEFYLGGVYRRFKFSPGFNNLSIAIFIVIASLSIIFLPNLPDIGTYEQVYYQYSDAHILDSHIEYGYNILLVLCSKLGISFFTFRFFITMTFTLLFLYGLINYSSNIPLSLLFFYTTIFIVSFLIQVRVGMALSIVVGLGLPCYYKRHYKRFLVFVLLASAFHLSILAVIMPFFLSRCSKSVLVKALALCFVVFLSRINTNFVIFNIANLFKIVPAADKISTYMWGYINNISLSSRDYVSIVLLILFLKKNRKDELYNFMYWAYFTGFFLKVFLRNFPEFAFRLYLVFQFPLLFLMPILFAKKNFILRMLIIIFLFINFFMLISSYGSGSIIKNG
jgi:hypothetical protein